MHTRAHTNTKLTDTHRRHEHQHQLWEHHRVLFVQLGVYIRKSNRTTNTEHQKFCASDFRCFLLCATCIQLQHEMAKTFQHKNSAVRIHENYSSHTHFGQILPNTGVFLFSSSPLLELNKIFAARHSVSVVGNVLIGFRFVWQLSRV